MSNLKCAVVFAALVTVSGIFPDTAKAQVRNLYRNSVIRSWSNNAKIFYPRVKPDGSEASQEELIYHRAIAQGEKGNHEAAAQLFIEIIKMNPEAAYAYRNLGLTYKNKLNNREMAVKCFRMAAKLYQQKGETSMAQNSIDLISSPIFNP
jgi:tetratricopeptide (TPR) repeat protein